MSTIEKIKHANVLSNMADNVGNYPEVLKKVVGRLKEVMDPIEKEVMAANEALRREGHSGKLSRFGFSFVNAGLAAPFRLSCRVT